MPRAFYPLKVLVVRGWRRHFSDRVVMNSGGRSSALLITSHLSVCLSTEEAGVCVFHDVGVLAQCPVILAWGKLTLGGIVSFALEATWADLTPLPSLGAQSPWRFFSTLSRSLGKVFI